jgi:PhzF family phenazine biosynthesis protein
VPDSTFYRIDVFAEEEYAGNQLAVIWGTDDLSNGAMQKIAAEMNYPETTFILSDEKPESRTCPCEPRRHKVDAAAVPDLRPHLYEQSALAGSRA